MTNFSGLVPPHERPSSDTAAFCQSQASMEMGSIGSVASTETPSFLSVKGRYQTWCPYYWNGNGTLMTVGGTSYEY